jgi:hypothetical protein
MGSGFDYWVCWHFFIITLNYNSSHVELLNCVSLRNLNEDSRTNLFSLNLSTSRMNSVLYLPHGQNIRHNVEQLIVLSSSVGCHTNLVFRDFRNVISEPLLSNGRLLWLRHSDFQP